MGHGRGFANGTYASVEQSVRGPAQVFRYWDRSESFASLLEGLDFDSPGLHLGFVSGCCGPGRHRAVGPRCTGTETATMGEEIEFCLLFAVRVLEGGFVVCRKDQDRILGSEREEFENGADNRAASDFVADHILDRRAPRYRHADESDFVVVNVDDCRSRREKVTDQVGRLAGNFLPLGGRQICRAY